MSERLVLSDFKMLYNELLKAPTRQRGSSFAHHPISRYHALNGAEYHAWTLDTNPDICFSATSDGSI